MRKSTHLNKIDLNETGLNEHGMTLIEIMIVLIIIAGMATAIITNVMKQLERAKVNQAKILISEVGKNLDQFNLDCGFYPTTDQGLQSLVQTPAGGKTCANWTEPYLKKVPQDPWHHDLIYTSDGSKYVLKSLGKDGKEGGEGFDKDISNEEQ